MKILWFTWKDKKNPASGGAEIINEEVAKRLVGDEHEVIFLTAGFVGAKKQEKVNGYKVIRLGNRYTVYFEAFKYYKKYLARWPDLIIEEINTIPFFTQFYAGQKKVLLIYQLCREIWFYQVGFPINFIGFFLEPLYLKLLSGNNCITESESTKKDLVKYGFNGKHIHLISAATDIRPVDSVSKTTKYPDFTILSFGTIRKMKRTADQIKAYEIAKNKIPSLRLIVAGRGEGNYGKYVLNLIRNSIYSSDITYFDYVDQRKKIELMQKSHVLLVTSIKEGWGLVVTEAASQATPAIVYNVDGLTDSVHNGLTGIICKENSPVNLANNIIKLHRNKKLYEKLKNSAWNESQKLTFENTYKDFIRII